MSVADVEVSRALNALVTTLNDQRPAEPDVRRYQDIVTGAVAGNPDIVVRADSTRPAAGTLRDRDGNALARFWRDGDRWLAEREGSPLSGGYIPS